jgi:hypothetical protein
MGNFGLVLTPADEVVWTFFEEVERHLGHA